MKKVLYIITLVEESFINNWCNEVNVFKELLKLMKPFKNIKKISENVKKITFVNENFKKSY